MATSTTAKAATHGSIPPPTSARSPTDPPFYAARVLAGTIGTKGGPVTDIDGTVLTKAGAPIPGLYAAGNAASFWTADAYPGPGATLAVGMTMGYRSGCHAADPGGKGTGYINA